MRKEDKYPISEHLQEDAEKLIRNYQVDLEMKIKYTLEHYIDKPFKGKVTKGRLRYRGISALVFYLCTPIGIEQKNNLITFDGYKVPYENGKLNYEKKTKIINL